MACICSQLVFVNSIVKSAVTFKMEALTFLVMNDATAGFQGNSETMIEITDYSGNLAALTIG